MDILLKNILTEMDRAVTNTATRVLPTINYGTLLSNDAEQVYFIAGIAGTMVAIRSKMTRLRKNTIDFKVTAEHETPKGKIARICEGHFTLVAIKPKNPYPTRQDPSESYTYFSSN